LTTAETPLIEDEGKERKSSDVRPGIAKELKVSGPIPKPKVLSGVAIAWKTVPVVNSALSTKFPVVSRESLQIPIGSESVTTKTELSFRTLTFTGFGAVSPKLGKPEKSMHVSDRTTKSLSEKSL
jgi:hypothetical protein